MKIGKVKKKVVRPDVIPVIIPAPKPTPAPDWIKQPTIKPAPINERQPYPPPEKIQAGTNPSPPCNSHPTLNAARGVSNFWRKENMTNPIPVYTQGDDFQGIDGKIQHILTTTQGSDTRTADNVIKGPMASMSVDEIRAAIAAFHERNGS